MIVEADAKKCMIKGFGTGVLHIRHPSFSVCPAFIRFPVMVDHFKAGRNQEYTVP